MADTNMTMLLVSTRPEAWQDFAAELTAAGYSLDTVHDLETCKARMQSAPPRLVVLDLPATMSVADVRKSVTALLMVNAMVHTAVVSGMEAEAFHEATEGLGILTSLPVQPAAAHARAMLELLAAV